jgi:hypothetical protein
MRLKIFLIHLSGYSGQLTVEIAATVPVGARKSDGEAGLEQNYAYRTLLELLKRHAVFVSLDMPLLYTSLDLL